MHAVGGGAGGRVVLLHIFININLLQGSGQ